MTVLVTGCCGFLGYHVCKYYRDEGERVIGIDNLTKHEYSRSGYDTEVVRDYVLDRLKIMGVEFHKDDIRTELTHPDYLDADKIAHCAAQPAMTVAIESPMYDFDCNVIGTMNVINLASKTDASMVNCSSVHVYGNNTSIMVPVDEETPVLRGTVTPLHASKLAAEHYCRAVADTYGTKVSTFRLSGMYGPMQFGGEDHGWVANFMIRHAFDRPIKVFGTTEQYRDILYVTDAVEAMDRFFETPRAGETYNIGGGEPRLFSIEKLFNWLEKKTGKVVRYDLLPERVGDMHWFCCDITKARSELGWSPTVFPHNGLANMYQWISSNKDLFT
jgi:CDP-paratose 2-epimerase